MSTINESLDTDKALSPDEVASGLKEALILGTNKAVDFAGAENRFWTNSKLRIPFPEEAEKVKTTATNLGLGSQVERFEENLNHAAEKAVAHATPIFVEALTFMSIDDAFSILNGGENAATQYLRQTTEEDLAEAFRPEVSKAINEVDLTKYWEPLASAYNTTSVFTGAENIDPDLENYVTEKAMNGLFLLIAEEEKNIRENPAARVTDLLEKVFGR